MADINIAPSVRVEGYFTRFSRFLDEEVAPLEKELGEQNVGTAANPALDEHGRMHPVVWEARREVQRRSARAGLYAPHISSTVGGDGFSRVEMHYVEEFVYRSSGLGLGLAALGWTEGPNPAIEHCSESSRQQWLEPLMRGEISAAFANTELAVGSDVLGMRTHAKPNGTDWVINGRKAWITNAHYADVLQVMAVTKPGAGTRSLSMFLVDANAAGVIRGRDMPTMLNDGLTGQLEFEDVVVPQEAVVGEVGDGFALAMAWINWRRLCRGGMCAGWGQWLLERAVSYAENRKSGGRPLAQLQAVRHLIADMDTDLYQARASSLVAQAELDQMGPYAMPLHARAPRLISLVKTINDKAFFRVADNAVQIHGGNGLRLGSPEEKLFRVARNLLIPAGTTEIQRNAIAHGVFDKRT